MLLSLDFSIVNKRGVRGGACPTPLKLPGHHVIISAASVCLCDFCWFFYILLPNFYFFVCWNVPWDAIEDFLKTGFVVRIEYISSLMFTRYSFNLFLHSLSSKLFVTRHIEGSFFLSYKVKN